MGITIKNMGKAALKELIVLDDLTVHAAVDITGAVSVLGDFALGEDGDGSDFTIYSAVASYKVWFDQDGDTNGAFYFGADTKGILTEWFGDTTGYYVRFDPSGDTNGAFYFGASTKGIDVLAYGTTAGNYLHWDKSADDLLLVGTATQLAIAGTTNATTTTSGSLRTAGGLAVLLDVFIGGGELNVANAATDIVIKANTDAALEIYDSTTKLIGIDTRNTVSGVEAIAFTPPAGEVPDGAASTRNGVVVKAATTTAAGTTGITTAFDGLSFHVEVPELVGGGGAVVVSKASTMYIAGPPTAGADMTITAPYALEVASGISLFGGVVSITDATEATALNAASLKTSGGLAVTLDMWLGGGELNVTTVATDIVVAANTAAALEVYDATTKLLAFDTRNTVSGVEVIALTPGAATLPDAADSTRNGVVVKAFTSTLVGTTQVTTAFDGLSFQVEVPTIAQSGGAVTVDKASTMYIAGPPTAGASVTLTAPYALEIASGNFLTAGDVYIAGGGVYVGADAAAGTLTLYPTTTAKGITTVTMADNAGATTTNINVAAQTGARTYTIPDAGASAAFLLTDSYKTWWGFACGLSGEDTDGAGTNGGGITGGAVDIATNMFDDGGGTVFVKVYDASMAGGTWDDLSTSATLDSISINHQLTPDAGSEAANDGFAVGFALKFCEICFDDLATGAGALATWSGAGGKWQYSKAGDTWGDITTIHDNTDSVDQTGGQPLVRTGAISFAPPSDWTSNTLDGQDAYWIRYLIENATLTQAALIDATAKDEPMVVVPNSDAFDAPFKATIGEIRVTDMGVTVHDAAIQFVVGNFTTGIFTEEFTWTASQYNDTFTPTSPLAVAANDKVGVLITDDAGSTVNPVLYVELEATYLD